MFAIRERVLSTLLVASVAAPASAHAVHERRQEIRAERELEDLTRAIGPVGFSDDGSGRVTLNGASVRVRQATVNGPVADVMSAVERDCKSGDYAVALAADPGPGEGRSRPVRLERVVSQESTGGVRASLCIFAAEPGANEGADVGQGAGSSEPLPRVRYTLAHQLDDGRTAVTTVVNESATPLAELFPASGDAPGSDLPDVARPEGARRVLTAAVGNGDYTVRIYESARSVESAVVGYDEAMTALGYATTGSLPTARMYRRDGRSFVASFIATTAGSNVTIAPFDGLLRTPASHLPSH